MDEEHAKSSPDPLRHYSLENFGDVYELGDFDTWTPALEAAVKDFLVNRVTDTDYAAFLKAKYLKRPIPSGSRQAQAEFIVRRHDPRIVGKALREAHVAVINTMPSLEQVVGDLQAWTEDTQDAAIIWLERHATANQLVQLARNTGNSALVLSRDEPRKWHRAYERDLLLELAGRLPNVLDPQALLQAWNAVLEAVGRSANDVVTAEKVRAWARASGLATGKRGRVSRDLVEQYRQALRGEAGSLWEQFRGAR